MPYVPSEKTPNPKGIVKDGKAQDRVLIDKAVKNLSQEIAEHIVVNKDIFYWLQSSINNTTRTLYHLLKNYIKEETLVREMELQLIDNRYGWFVATPNQCKLALAIYQTGKSYGYQGAFLGELNYAITRLIQEVPKRLVEQGKQEKELRYFIYVYVIASLIQLSQIWNRFSDEADIGAVFEDIKDEYKRRVNTGYEAAQIVKSGDCYDTPYYTKLVEIIDEGGKVIGHQEVMIKRENDNGKDILGRMKIVLD